MLPESWNLSPLMNGLLTSGMILGAFLLAMLVVQLLWRRVLGPLVSRTDTELDDIILIPLRGVVVWGLFLLGLYYSLDYCLVSIEAAQAKPVLVRVMKILERAFPAAWTALVIWALMKVLDGLAAWSIRKAAAHPERPRDISPQATLGRRAAKVLLLAIGVLYVLRAAGVDITPLAASGAIGGLAVALALQDTLSNLFGGFFLAIDRPVRVGDFVRLESGDEGYVDEIGWRHTKIRLLANNVVVIPNSKLSQSVITNYFLPQQEMSVVVPCGVAYDSDLQRVEEVVLEVARDVMSRVPGAATEWTPVVRWKQFGDSSVNFVAVLRVKQFEAQYALQSEFVKALHHRFQTEGIEIPFPIRTVIVKNPATGDFPPGLERRESR